MSTEVTFLWPPKSTLTATGPAGSSSPLCASSARSSSRCSRPGARLRGRDARPAEGVLLVLPAHLPREPTDAFIEHRLHRPQPVGAGARPRGGLRTVARHLPAASLGADALFLGMIISVSTLTGMVFKPLFSFLNCERKTHPLS